MFASYPIWQRKTFFVIVSILFGLSLGLLTLKAISFPLRTSILIFIAVGAPITAIISGNLKHLLLFLLVLNISLNIDVNLGHDPIFIDNPNGYNISVVAVSLLNLYTIWLIEILYKKSKVVFFSEIGTPLLGLIGAGLLSLVNSVNITFSIYEIIQLCELFLLFLYISNHIKDKKDIKVILYAIILGVIIQALLVTVQYVTRTQYDLLGNIGTSVNGLFRPNGTFGHPNSVAGYIVPMLAICISLYLSKMTVTNKLITLAATLLGIATLAGALSRGGWISFLLALWILMLGNLQYQQFKISPNILLVSITGVVILAGLFGPAILHRVTSDYQPIISRLPLMQIAFNMIGSHPIFGVGINNFGIVLKDYLYGLPPSSWLYVVHSKYLMTWAETGTVGFFFFLWLLYAMFRKGLQTLRLKMPFYSVIALGIVAGLAGLSMHMLGDTFQGRSEVMKLGLFAALLVGIYNLSQSGNQLEDQSISKSSR